MILYHPQLEAQEFDSKAKLRACLSKPMAKKCEAKSGFLVVSCRTCKVLHICIEFFVICAAAWLSEEAQCMVVDNNLNIFYRSKNCRTSVDISSDSRHCYTDN